MPACIVLVHDDPGFANPALAALRAAGYDAVGFQDSMSAIDALEHPKRIELLITRVRFPSGTPNGVALACMARLKRPGIKVLFTSFPEVRQHTDGIGEFLPRPLSSDELLETVARMLDNHPIRLPGSPTLAGLAIRRDRQRKVGLIGSHPTPRRPTGTRSGNNERCGQEN